MVPLVLVQAPGVNVWVSPAPATPVSIFSVPPEPFIVKAPPFTLPVRVATPPVLSIDTVPVVVNPAIVCAAVPARLIAEAPALNVPVLRKFP